MKKYFSVEKIKQWWTTLLMKFNDDCPTIPLEELSTFDQCWQLYQTNHVELFHQYRQRDGQGRQIQVVYTSLEDYIAHLKQLIKVIKKDGSVPLVLCHFEVKTISLNQFFLTKDNHYPTELVSTLMQFRHLVVDLCQLIHQSTHEEYDAQDYHLRVLSPLFNSLLDIELVLHAISETF